MNVPIDVSVILPVYNSEAFIKEAVESIIKQTHSSFEIIAVEDGSTDNSGEILKGISDPRLKIIYQENSGTAVARNRGVKESKGKYLAFLDADDLWAPNKIEIQLQAIQKINNPVMMYSYIQEFFDFDNSPNLKSEAVPGYSAVTLFISKENFFQVGWFDSQWTVAEFIDWYGRAKNVGLVEKMLPDVLAYRRIHSGNMDRLKRNNVKQYASVLKACIDRKRGYD